MNRILQGAKEALAIAQGASIGERITTPAEELLDMSPAAMLKGARYREDMTQVQLAEATGIPRRHISDMENGRRPIGKQAARKFADVLRVDYRVFL